MGFGCVDALPRGRAAVLPGRQAEQPLAFHVGAQAQGACLRVGLQPAGRCDRLAASGQAVRDDEPGGARVGQPPGERQVSGHVRRCATGGLGAADARHLGPYHGAVDRVEPQHGCRVVVAAVTQHLVEEPAGQRALPVVEQVGVGECDVAGHVDPAQVFVEFEAVEHPHLPVDADQVGQVQVTVAFADVSPGLAALQVGFDAVELGVGPGQQTVQALAHRGVGGHRQQFLEVFQGRCPHLRRPPEAAVRWSHGRARMELRQVQGEIRQMVGAQFTTCAQVVQPAGFVEAPHAHQVLDRRLVHLPLRPVGGAVQGQHIQIEVGRETPVETQLVLAAGMAQGQRAEVQERQLQGLLDLVGEFAGQQHPGDMGLDEFGRAGHIGKEAGPQQAADQGWQVGIHGAMLPQWCAVSAWVPVRPPPPGRWARS